MPTNGMLARSPLFTPPRFFMRNIKLILEYDGTNYHGWQTQAGSGRPTIQETVEHALATLSGEPVTTYSSGRTDAGVHALGHVANFRTGSTIPAPAWAPALNHLLPPDIRVLSSESVSDDFHARYSALGKTYRYRILCRRAPTALFRNYAWHINVPLDVPNMRKSLDCLVGRHDFSSFQGAGCTAKSPVRTITGISLTKTDDFLDLVIEADAFLQYMVRNIVGTAVEIGLGRFTPDDMAAILLAQDRKKAGRTAPAQGLYLIKVTYPEIIPTNSSQR
jgi:tRNA pseudouridine38-40 synthase